MLLFLTLGSSTALSNRISRANTHFGKLHGHTSQETHGPVLMDKSEEKGGNIWSKTAHHKPEELKVAYIKRSLDPGKPEPRLLCFNVCVNVNVLNTG